MCHEVGNHFAALRLIGHVLRADALDEETINEVESLSADGGRYLAQIRMLLSKHILGAQPHRMGAMMRELRMGLGELLDGPVDIEFSESTQDTTFTFEPEVVNRQWLALATDAIVHAQGKGSISVCTAVYDTHLCFCVEDDSNIAETDLDRLDILRGRPLFILSVRAVMRRFEGDLELKQTSRGSRILLKVPR